jgi:hypothetical protein
MRVRCTLLGDGTSDRALEGLIRWSLHQQQEQVEVEQWHWADLSLAPRRPVGLHERVRAALRLYPCDLLFVHRDAEREAPQHRYTEIEEACRGQIPGGVSVPVVPVRMTEAWLLHDEASIRMASGNPNGREPLQLPRTAQVESLPDPKQCLKEALLRATALSGRRRERARGDLGRMCLRVSELIEDYAPLSGVPAFDAFQSALQRALEQLRSLQQGT